MTKKIKTKTLVNITNLQRKQDIDQKLVLCTAETTIKNLFCGSYSLDIIFCSANYIKNLNRSYREKNSATDVLSFESKEFIGELFYVGEIYIAPAVALKNALAYKDFWEKEKWVTDIDNGTNDVGIERRAEYFLLHKELTLLIIHGILHLFGYNHDEEHSAEINDENYDKDMKKMQKTIYKQIYAQK